MQYIYTECKLPSNGKLYPTTTVHLRPKTIFDIKMLLNNPAFILKSEIDALQGCINPEDNVNVYDLVNQDVVYLLYKLRSLSDDCLKLTIKNKEYDIKISELDVEYLQEWNNERTLPDSGMKVELAYQPIKNIFNLEQQKQEFEHKYPEYVGDALNTVALINAVDSLDGSVNKDQIRNKMESLSWKDSLYLLQEIENINKLQFGIKEEVELNIEGEKVTVPIQITEAFFRPAL